MVEEQFIESGLLPLRFILSNLQVNATHELLNQLLFRLVLLLLLNVVFLLRFSVVLLLQMLVCNRKLLVLSS